jgi:hypothetical protein
MAEQFLSWRFFYVSQSEKFLKGEALSCKCLHSECQPANDRSMLIFVVSFKEPIPLKLHPLPLRDLPLTLEVFLLVVAAIFSLH